jgi:hypothetical protein
MEGWYKFKPCKNPEPPQGSPSILKRMVMLFRGKWSFINYRKEFRGKYPIDGVKPKFSRYWMGDIWHFGWRGFAVVIDMRTNWLADMTKPNRPNRYEA